MKYCEEHDCAYKDECPRCKRKCLYAIKVPLSKDPDDWLWVVDLSESDKVKTYDTEKEAHYDGRVWGNYSVEEYYPEEE